MAAGLSRHPARDRVPLKWRRKAAVTTASRAGPLMAMARGLLAVGSVKAAVNGGADALVTLNVRNFGTVPTLFGIKVLLPREAIGRIHP